MEEIKKIRAQKYKEYKEKTSSKTYKPPRELNYLFTSNGSFFINLDFNPSRLQEHCVADKTNSIKGTVLSEFGKSFDKGWVCTVEGTRYYINTNTRLLPLMDMDKYSD